MAPPHAEEKTNGSVVEKKPNKVADLANNYYGDLSRYDNPVKDDEYQKLIGLINERLPGMSIIKALFSVIIAQNQPKVIIDARSSNPKIVEHTDEVLDAEIKILPQTIWRLQSGNIESRHAIVWGHMVAEGQGRQGRIAIKFADLLSPVNPTHPKLPSDTSLLPKPTDDYEQAKKDLQEWGYCLITNSLAPGQLESLRKRLREQADGEKAAGVGTFDGGEHKPNQRVWNLVNKGQEFLDLLENPIVDDLVPDILGDGFTISSFTANITRPGNAPMLLHNDQGQIIQTPLRNIGLGLNIMWFLTDVNDENGGTRVMPGSHLGDQAPDDQFDLTDTVAAEGPAGTALVFDTRLWHSTGPNRTKTGERPVVILFLMRAFIRPLENSFLSLDREVEKTLTEKARALLGFRVTAALGGVEGRTRDGKMVQRVDKPITAIRA
jgi:hypothetical protein